VAEDVVFDRDEWMRRTGPLYPGIVALRNLTVVRLPRALEPTPDDMARSAPWFAVIGAIVGGVLALAAILLLGADLVPAIAGGIVLVLAVVVAGALHEVGLTRSVDVLAAGTSDDTYYDTPDTRSGLFGLLALMGLFAVRALGLLGTDTDKWVAAIIISQVTLRWSVLLLLKIGDRLGEPRTDHRTLMVGDFSWAMFGAATAVASVIAVIFAGGLGLAALIVAALLAFGVGLFFQRKFGGLNRHSLGAASVLCEVSVLICFAAAHPASASPWVVQ
jgi:adenosylcobinamide-GDP ribazoletransferase